MSTVQRLKRVLIFSLLMPAIVTAAPVEDVIDVQESIEKSALQSQKKIDGLAEQTSSMLIDYRNVLNQTESTQTYNKQLDTLIESQQQELKSIDQQLENITATQRDILPLMTKMIDTLEQFVELDIPFLLDERRSRVANLKALMARADLSLAEKYRRILEAYQVETEYGRTIEAYQASLEQDGQQRTFDFLRVGRVGLYSLSLDGQQSAAWNANTKQWQPLPADQNKLVKQGLKVALKQLPPDLLVLPVLAAEAAK